jgi:uncharacterized protein (UPF0276 family)
MLEPLLMETNLKQRHCVGVGLKPEHGRVILESKPAMGFFEVHAENYMGAGGPPHRLLTAIRDAYPLSIHGVGLSIGADRPLALPHLQRLGALVARYEPQFVSEHFAWSRHDGGFLNDLLPVPYTDESLSVVVDHIDQIQSVLGRRLLLENPSTYLVFEHNTYAEGEWIAEVVKRTGCALLLDVNNAYIACINHQWDPCAYIDAFPLDAVEEIHLAGHARDVDERGHPVLIDTHDRRVDEAVWDLYRHTIRRTGALPTLVEWDASLPAWSILEAEALRAQSAMRDAVQAASASRTAGEAATTKRARLFQEVQPS